jgi:hypothetical protein
MAAAAIKMLALAKTPKADFTEVLKGIAANAHLWDKPLPPGDAKTPMDRLADGLKFLGQTTIVLKDTVNSWAELVRSLLLLGAIACVLYIIIKNPNLFKIRYSFGNNWKVDQYVEDFHDQLADSMAALFEAAEALDGVTAVPSAPVEFVGMEGGAEEHASSQMTQLVRDAAAPLTPFREACRAFLTFVDVRQPFILALVKQALMRETGRNVLLRGGYDGRVDAVVVAANRFVIFKLLLQVEMEMHIETRNKVYSTDYSADVPRKEFRDHFKITPSNNPWEAAPGEMLTPMGRVLRAYLDLTDSSEAPPDFMNLCNAGFLVNTEAIGGASDLLQQNKTNSFKGRAELEAQLEAASPQRRVAIMAALEDLPRMQGSVIAATRVAAAARKGDGEKVKRLMKAIASVRIHRAEAETFKSAYPWPEKRQAYRPKNIWDWWIRFMVDYWRSFAEECVWFWKMVGKIAKKLWPASVHRWNKFFKQMTDIGTFVPGFKPEVVEGFIGKLLMKLFKTIFRPVYNVFKPIIETFINIFKFIQWLAKASLKQKLLAIVGFFVFIVVCIIVVILHVTFLGPLLIFLPMLLFTVLLALIVTVLVLAVYVIVFYILMIFALFDCFFSGFPSFFMRRTFTCFNTPHNWYQTAYSHLGNRFMGRKIAGLCVGCMKPCPAGMIPNGKSCKSFTNNVHRKFAAIPAIQRVRQGESIFSADIEPAPAAYGHEFIKFAPVSANVCKYGGHTGIEGDVLRAACSLAFCSPDHPFSDAALCVRLPPLDPMDFAKIYNASPADLKVLLTVVGVAFGLSVAFLIFGKNAIIRHGAAQV